MNKAVKVILNILIVIAGIIFLASLADMKASFQHAEEQKEDLAENRRMVFEYKLEKHAYGEILSTYYTYHTETMVDSGEEVVMQELYRVAEYAHAAFMAGVYEEKGDESAIRANAAKREDARNNLGAYAYTADVVDEMLRKAP